MSDLRSFTLWARALLTKESGDLLTQVYRLETETGSRLPIPKGHVLETSTEAQSIQRRVEKLLDDEVDAGLKRKEAVAKLIRETAFTHLNRFVAFKLMEATRLIRSPLARRHEANGFKMWLGSHAADATLYDQGDNPNERDGFGEAPRDRAYRHFLLWQCGELAKEIKVLFDPENLPSRLFPRPGVLKELIDGLNADDRKDDWAAGNEETVGWVYQYFNSEELEAAFAEARLSGKKFAKEDIPSVTQLFTPRPTVRFLVDNTLGRLWISMHPDSRIGSLCPYLTPLAADPPQVPMKPVKEIRVLDPAKGTMHFGLVAFDLLAEMYREELDCAGTAGWPAQPSIQEEAEISAAILANNLFGIDIDLRAVQLAALALYLKAKAANKTAVLTDNNLACANVAIFRGQHLEKIISEMVLPPGLTPELFVKFRDSLEEASMMGSLVRLEKHFQNFQSELLRQAIHGYIQKKRTDGIDETYFANETAKGLRLLEVLERRYDVVFTNPPYVSAPKMNREMSRFLKANYKDAKGDLFAAFIQRCLELTSNSGVMGMLTMHSFMFISGYRKFREFLAENAVVEVVAHYGPGLFAVGNPGTLQTAAFVLRREQFEVALRKARGVYFRLVNEADSDSKSAAFVQALARRRAGEPDSRVYEYRQGDFAAIPGGPWVYWADEPTRSVFSRFPELGTLYEMDRGLITCDVFRFVRAWWELGLSRIGEADSRAAARSQKQSRWFWYAKGETGEGIAQLKSIVNWHLDGAEVKASLIEKYPYLNGGVEWLTHNEDRYFSPCVTWSHVSSTGFKARLMEKGAIASDSSYAIFADGKRAKALYAYLTSLPARYLIRILCSTLNYNKGDLSKLPVPSTLLDDIDLNQLADLELQQYQDEGIFDELSPKFVVPVGYGNVERRESNTRDQIDQLVVSALGLAQDRSLLKEFLSLPLNDEEDTGNTEDTTDEQTIEDRGAEENGWVPWISYAVGIALGRFTPGKACSLGQGQFSQQVNEKLSKLIDPEGLMLVYRDHPDDLAQRVIDIIAAINGEAEASRIVRTAVGGNGDLRDALASYLLGPFFKAHVRLYRKRPIYWLLQSPRQTFSVYLLHERATDQTLALLQGKRYLGGRRFELKEQLHQAKQKELITQGKEKAQWKRKAQEAAEELSDLDAFQKAIDDTNAEPIVNGGGQSATARWVPEFDDGVLLNAAPLRRLMPAWKKADPKLDLSKVWKALKDGEYPWAKTALRYWPRETLAACKQNKSYRIAHGLE